MAVRRLLCEFPVHVSRMCGDSVPNLARPGTKDVSFYSVDVCDDTMVGGASPESDAPAGMKHLHDYSAFQIRNGRVPSWFFPIIFP